VVRHHNQSGDVGPAIYFNQLLLSSYHHDSSIDDVGDPEPRLRDMQLYKPGKLMKRNSFPSPYAAANAIQSAHLSITCMRHLSYVHSGSTIASGPDADARLGLRTSSQS
jgi:hypothetical protein